MRNFRYSLSNRILAFFLAICMIAMACFPSNISYANSDEISNESTLEEEIEENEEEVVEHDWTDATCTEPKTCNECGETEGKALDHDWKDATCTEAKTCSECGEIEGEELGHDWKDATCTEAKTCSECGETEGEALGHDWEEATCTKAKTCSECGETEGKELGHDWIVSMDGISKICDICEKTEVVEDEHKWEDATCTKPKTCSECGKTEGEALGHDWANATCTKARTCNECGETEGRELEHDWIISMDGISKICNICEKTEVVEIEHKWVDATCIEAKTCSECGKTEGEALGHDWANATCTKAKTCKECGKTEGEELGHDWIDATCTKAKTCKECGKIEGEALGHVWEDNIKLGQKICNKCGEVKENEIKDIPIINGSLNNNEIQLGGFNKPTNNILMSPSKSNNVLMTTASGEEEEELPNNPTIDRTEGAIRIGLLDANGNVTYPDKQTYVGIGQTIQITFRGDSLVTKYLSVKLKNDINLVDNVKLNENLQNSEYVARKIFSDSDSNLEGNIEFYIFQDGKLLTSAIPTPFVFDMTPPVIAPIEAPTYNAEIGSNEAFVYINTSDNNGVNAIKQIECMKDNGNWEVVKLDGDKYTFTKMGKYKFRVIDKAGNISDESRVIDKEGNISNEPKAIEINKCDEKVTSPGVKIVKYPKLEYAVGDKFSLEGGMFKVGYTFDVCECAECVTECSCETIWLCEDGCDCGTDVCTNYHLECLLVPMVKIDANGDVVLDANGNTKLNDGVTAKYASNITEEVGNGKLVEVSYLGYTETFNINVSLSENTDYILEIEEPTKIKTPIKAIVTTDLTNAEYTWSTSPDADDVGKEEYRAGLVDNPIKNADSGEIETPADDVDDVCTSFRYEYADTLAWKLSNNSFIARTLPFKDQAKSSISKIIINTGHTGGEISFKWQTHTLLSHKFIVRFDKNKDGDLEDDVDIILDVAGNDKDDEWQTFTYNFGENYFDEDDVKDFVIELSYSVDGTRLPITNDSPVIIKDLVFRGEKVWHTLGAVDSNNQVEVILDKPLGPDNYLHIRDKSVSSRTLMVSENCEGDVDVVGIDIINPPSLTLYTVDETNTEETVDLTDGYMRIIYTSGEKEVYIEDLDGISVNDGSNKIDVSKPGIKKVKITYDGYTAYFPVVVVDDDYEAPTTPNAPVLRPGMIPVIWSEPDENEEGYWVATTQDDSSWYNYDSSNKIWANVMLRDDIVISGVKASETSESKLAGKKIISDGSMFVWVPRFEYKVTRKGKTDIKWIEGTGPSTTTNYTLHPAFTYNGQELPGFWMAKFEASEGESVAVASKADRQSYYTGISLQDAYDYSISMTNDYREYGVDFSGTVTHLTKPNEWGAVAILAYSSYGSIPYNNNFADGYGDDSLAPRTGYSGEYDGAPEAKEGDGIVTISMSESEEGSLASTTGNAYGIFDMSGGVKEYVAAYVKYDSAYLATRAALYKGKLGYPGYDETKLNPQDIDVINLIDEDFDNTDDAFIEIFEAVEDKDGWAMFELKSTTAPEYGDFGYVWNDDVIQYNGKFNDAFLRGGDVNSASEAGILATSVHAAAGDVTTAGFRPTILIVNENAEAEVTFKGVTIFSTPDPDKDPTIPHNPFYAGEGDSIVIKVETSHDAKIINPVLMCSDGTILTPVKVEDGSTINTITYVIPKGLADDAKINGEVSFSFDIVSPKGNPVESNITEAKIKDGSSVTIDTTQNELELDPPKISEGETTYEFDIEYGIHESDVNIVVKDEDGNSIVVTFSKNSGTDDEGNEIKTASGSITLPKLEQGVTSKNYTIYITDAAGNQTEKVITIKSGSDYNEGDSNNITPELDTLSVFVYVDGVPVKISDLSDYDRYWILRDDKVRFEITFYQDLREGVKDTGAEVNGPDIYLENGRKIPAEQDLDNPFLWTAEVVMDDLNAYDNFTFTITDYWYGSNPGADIIGHNYDIIPYDGSNVNVIFKDVEIWQEVDGEWTKVEKAEDNRFPINLIYTVVFSDNIKFLDSTPGAEDRTDNFDEDYGVKLAESDITILNGFTSGKIEIEEVSTQIMKITFNNVSGEGLFSFSIRGANPYEPVVVNPVAQDIYGHPNNQTNASGIYAIEIGEYTGGSGGGGEPSRYVIEFNDNGGAGGPGYQFKPRGEDINLKTEVPTKEGYTFKGWSLSEGAKVVNYQPGDLFTIDADTVLYAVWEEENAVRLTVISGDVTSSSIEDPDTTINVTAAIANGYVFACWEAIGIVLTDEQIVSPTISFVMPNNDVILTVIYVDPNDETYLISYDANGGENAPASQIKFVDVDILLRSEIPNKEGHTFLGWATTADAELVEYASGASFSENEDTTLYAVWAVNDYTVTFNANGGESVNPGSKSVTYGSAYGELAETSRTGYTFAGWYTAADGGSEVTAETIVTNIENHTLYAHWEVDTYTVSGTVNPEGSGNISGLGGYTYGCAVTLTANANAGYTFSSWEVVSGGVTLTIEGNTATFTMPANDVEVRANFIAGGYTVSGTVEPVAGGSISGLGGYTYGSSVELTANANEGYTFSSWEVVSGGVTLGNTETVTFAMPANDVEVRANYTANEYTVTFDANGGESVNPGSKNVTYGSAYGELAETSRTDYIFAGWYTAADGGSEVTAETIVTTAGNHTLYAHWSMNKVNVYVETVNSRAYGEETIGTSITVNAEVANGYRFVSWTVTGIELTSEQLTSPSVTFTVPANNVTLVANYDYSHIDSYTVTYDGNGGYGAPESQEKTHGVDLILSSTEPIRDGYIFLGWSANSSATEAEYIAGATYSVDANVTLYAVWAINAYNVAVSINPTNAGSILGAGSKTPGNTVTLTANASVGYTFSSWEAVSGGVDLSSTTELTTTFTMPNNNVEIRANYELKKYIVRYDANNGNNAPGSQEKTHGVDLTLSSDLLTRDGYIFEGWNTASNGSGTSYSIGGTYSIDDDVILYAVWRQVGVTITGTNTYGQTLTANLAGIPEGATTSYQWYSNTTNSQANGTLITGATSNTYTIGSGLINKYIYVVVTVTNDNSTITISDITDASNTSATVSKVKLTKPTAVSTTYNYNSDEQTLELNDFDSTTMNITGNTETDVDEYTAIISLKDTTNYMWADTTTSNVSITWKIEAKVYATLYTDGTLGFSNDNSRISGKTVRQSYGDVGESHYTWDENAQSYINAPAWSNRRSSITTVTFVNEVAPLNTALWFDECTNLRTINNISNLNTSRVLDMYCMFYQCSSLTSVDLSNFDTSNVTNMSYMFYECTGLSTLNVSSFDTSNVTNMEGMFYVCSGLASLNLSNFDTSNVTTMGGMFAECSSLSSLDLSNFNTSKVTTVTGMFANCSNLGTLNIRNWSKTRMSDTDYMFYGCDKSGFTITVSSNTMKTWVQGTSSFPSTASVVVRSW